LIGKQKHTKDIKRYLKSAIFGAFIAVTRGTWNQTIEDSRGSWT